MAVNCWVSPAAMEAVVGETVMATSTAGVTTRAAVPESGRGIGGRDGGGPCPYPGGEARELEAVETVAEVEVDDQVTDRSGWVLPSE